MKLITAFEAFLNCTFVFTDWPGASVVREGIVIKGLPLNVPELLTSVTFLGNDLNSIWNPPLFGALMA